MKTKKTEPILNRILLKVEKGLAAEKKVTLVAIYNEEPSFRIYSFIVVVINMENLLN